MQNMRDESESHTGKRGLISTLNTRLWKQHCRRLQPPRAAPRRRKLYRVPGCVSHTHTRLWKQLRAAPGAREGDPIPGCISLTRPTASLGNLHTCVYNLKYAAYIRFYTIMQLINTK